MTSQTEEPDVVIVGAGPTGLMLAIELRLAGATPLILERLPEISEVPKGNGLFGQIVPFLNYRGLLDPLRADATYAGPAPQFFFGTLQLKFSRLPVSPLEVLGLPQRQLEAKLAGRLAELGGSIRRGHEVTAITHGTGSETLTVTGPAGEYRLRTRYLVGCDGAHSVVRKSAGIGFPGYTSTLVARIGRVLVPPQMIARSGEIEVPGIGRLVTMRPVRTPRGLYTLGPQAAVDKNARPGSYIISTHEEQAGTDLDAPMTLEELQASFARVLGADVPLRDPQWLTRVVGNTRQAERYRDGRLLLAGDAAHVSGLGGSLNGGMLDAVNLGWKLAAELRGTAPAGLLDTYHAERHAAGERTLLQSRAQRALQGDDPYLRALRDLVGELLEFAEPQRHVGELIAGSDVRYDMAASGPAGQPGPGPRPGPRPHPLTGYLCPDLKLTTAGGSTSVAELMRAARAVALDFGSDGRVAAAAAGWTGHVSVLNVKPRGGTPPADALLLRPDGWVAWAAGPGAADPAAGLADALRTWCAGVTDS